MNATQHNIPELDNKGLREFALVTGAVVVILFGIFFPWVFELSWPKWPWIFAGILIAVGFVAPASLGPVYRGWMRFGQLLSKVTTPIIMGLVFFLVITPIGLVRRFTAGDALSKELEDLDTYRITTQKTPPKNMERPY